MKPIMEKVGLASRLLQHPLVYRFWQAPFADSKFSPVREFNDLNRVRSVLDVGCGPGTNSKYFMNSDYLGVDNNPAYIRYASRRYRKKFETADITTYCPANTQFDFILLNSFLHHLDEEATSKVLRQVKHLLTQNGTIHILDLISPEEPGIARFLARHDRGNYPRPLPVWKQLFEANFQPLVFKPYTLNFLGVVLWKMLYFKGCISK